MADANATEEKPTRRRRRTQEERRTETRALLLDVTLECLAELGYQNTTGQVVADRAGLSRGAQLHHFGSKTALVLAAMEHLFERGEAQFRAELAATPEGENRVSAAIDVLWKIMSGPTGYAYLELVWASRTDPELGKVMYEVVDRIDKRVEQTFNEIFSDAPGSHEFFEVAWTAIFALIEGLAVEKTLAGNEGRVDAVIEAVKRLAPNFVQARV